MVGLKPLKSGSLDWFYGMTDIPPDHPRYRSLVVRERLVEMFRRGVVVPQGLIAHGRGECFDYLLGEETVEEVLPAYEAAAALLKLSSKPVIAVNGNSAALAYEDIAAFSRKYDIPVEINLFHFSRERVDRIAELFREVGLEPITDLDVELPKPSSMRRLVSSRGIYSADTVLVMIEDGDFPEALRELGKKVIALDLNPLSRTARNADITIVDNITRFFPLLDKYMESLDPESAREVLARYDNDAVLKSVLRRICLSLTT